MRQASLERGAQAVRNRQAGRPLRRVSFSVVWSAAGVTRPGSAKKARPRVTTGLSWKNACKPIEELRVTTPREAATCAKLSEALSRTMRPVASSGSINAAQGLLGAGVFFQAQMPAVGQVLRGLCCRAARKPAMSSGPACEQGDLAVIGHLQRAKQKRRLRQITRALPHIGAARGAGGQVGADAAPVAGVMGFRPVGEKARGLAEPSFRRSPRRDRA